MDPIADMFSQIKNTQLAGKKSLTVPFSNMKMALLSVLKSKNYILDFKEMASKKEEASAQRKIEITVGKQEVIKIQRISRPGRRVYTSSSRIPRRKSPTGLVIVSTSEGVMAGEEARKKGIGGEVVAEIV